MQTKDYTITLDMIRTIPFRPFEVVEGDTGNVLHITLLNNGDPMNLTDCNVCVAFASSAGFAMQDETSGIVRTGETGSFDITLLPTAYGAGNVSADVQVYSGQDKATLITSTRFDFRCRRTLVDGEILRASSAYPPLIEAARVATEAAERALAAAERASRETGELNVQSDWLEADDGSDAYIRSKPTIPSMPADVGAAAALHAAQHGPDGEDPVTPIAHALRHASDGPDALAPADILAAGRSSLATATLLAANWSSAAYTLAVSGVTAASAVEILPGAYITEAQLEALQEANIQDGGQSAGSITLNAFGDAPTIDIPIRIIVRGDLYA